MSMTRSIALRLAAGGTCLILQKGKIVTPAPGDASLTQDSFQGPIRIRLAVAAAAAGVGKESSTSCNNGGKNFTKSDSHKYSTRK